MQMKIKPANMEIIKLGVLTIIFIMPLVLLACSSEPTDDMSQETKIPVKTKIVQSEEVADRLHYIGLVSSNKVVNKSFKVEGRILDVYVEEGEQVETGQALLVLEPVDLEYALEAAKSDHLSAIAQENKARQAYVFAQSHFEDIKALYDQGAVSKIEFDQAKLNFNGAKADLESASERVKQAKTALDQSQDMQAESILYAPFDGQANRVLVESGEFVSTGYPVVVLSDNKKTVFTGVSQEDVQKVQPGMEAEVTIDEIKSTGIVKTVNSIPDQDTRTYQVAIDVEVISYPVGAVGDVDIIVGTREGIKIPVSSVLSSSTDYVYVVEENRAIKKEINLEGVVDTNVYVSGLDPGDELIIEGMKNVKNLSEVNILSE